MRKRIFGFAAVIAATLFASVVHPQPALKMMIPANPGGGWDQTGRQLAAAMLSLCRPYNSKIRAAPAAPSAWRSS